MKPIAIQWRSRGLFDTRLWQGIAMLRASRWEEPRVGWCAQCPEVDPSFCSRQVRLDKMDTLVKE